MTNKSPDIFGNPTMKQAPSPRSRPQKHPAYGYASPEQIEELQRLRYGTEYEELWKKIELQHKRRKMPE